MAIPVLFFAAVEGVLRLTGAGDDYPLFVPHPQHPDYLLANPDVIKRFFGNPDRAPSMKIETVFFRTSKPANSLRIFVQGGSSAAGFPYGFGGSLTGMLEQRLRRVYPQRDIEVVNTAMSAVNSYTLLDFADEIIAQQPDAVLIYAGHNEYLGILGVGSAFLGGHPPRVTRLYVSLRKLYLFQFMQTIYTSLVGAPDPSPPDAADGNDMMMSRVAAERHIAYGSAMYRQGLNQFRGNLTALVRRYTRAGVPVYVGTVVSNEKDQPPFNSAPGEEGAAAWFARAEAAYAAGDWDSAREAYQAARDRDELRFRAPGAFNDIIAATTAEGARLVDVDGAFRAESTHGILGSELVLEHVHPTLRGYFLLADAFFEALVADGLTGDALMPVDDVQAWNEVPVSEVDRLFGEYKVALVRQNWPFSDTPGRPRLPDPDSVPAMIAQQLYAQTIDWTAAHRRLARHYQSVGDAAGYLKVSLILADAVPFDTDFQYRAGTALIEAGRSRQALGYLYRGARLAPRDLNLLLALSHALILNGANPQAREVLTRVLALDPDNRTARAVIDQIDAASSPGAQ